MHADHAGHSDEAIGDAVLDEDFRGDTMSDLIDEQLSACLDGELSDAELRLLLKRTARDAGTAQALGRYALISEALRHTPVRPSADFCARISAAVAQEPVAKAAPLQRLSPMLRYLRPAAGMAIAASVATVAVLALQQPVGPSVAPTLIADQSAPALQLPQPETLAPSYVVPSSTGPAARTPQIAVPAARVTNYVVAHSEYSSPLGRRSVLTGVLAGDHDEEAELQVLITEEAEADSAAPAKARPAGSAPAVVPEEH